MDLEKYSGLMTPLLKAIGSMAKLSALELSGPLSAKFTKECGKWTNQRVYVYFEKPIVQSVTLAVASRSGLMAATTSAISTTG